MDTYHAAYWSDPCYTSSEEEEDDSRDRITHQPRTKQRGIGQQRSQDSWTWEEILDGKGPWSQAGEYRRPKAELEAAKAERRRYEEAARQRDSLVGPVAVARTRLSLRLLPTGVPICPAPPALPVCPAPSELSVCQAPPALPVCPAPSEPPVCPEPSEPSVSQEPLEPSVSQEPLEPSVSQELPEPPASQELPEPPASQELPLSQEPPLSPKPPLSPELPLSPVGPLIRILDPRSEARVVPLKRPLKRAMTMVEWGLRPAPEPPP
ncbi:uncharacterized protein ACWYII_044800 isoform 2-T2 [Salvelinus alpinus]